MTRNAIFGVSILIIFLLMALAWFRESVQFNVIFITLLAFSSAIAFAFVPVEGGVNAAVDLKWIKAGGATAIFIAVMWFLIPHAQTMNQGSYEARMLDLNTKISSANTEAINLNAKISELLDQIKRTQEGHASETRAYVLQNQELQQRLQQHDAAARDLTEARGQINSLRTQIAQLERENTSFRQGRTTSMERVRSAILQVRNAATQAGLALGSTQNHGACLDASRNARDLANHALETLGSIQ
jgi:polyhydroxyalkanoate synthesis regulator phasin